MKAYTLYPATRKGSRYLVYVPKGDHLIAVSFGATDYDNFTIHKDEERRKRYRIRHRNDSIADPYHPGFWSWWVLWNKPSLMESFQEAVHKAKMLIK
jgi:hypothetical protein